MASPTSAELQRSADAAAARGAFADALRLLDQAADIEAGFDLHVKRAAMARALRDPARALDAVTAALTFAPLDFMALLMRASLLEQAGLDSGEAYQQALAQRPAAIANPQVAAAVRHGEEVRDRWIADKGEHLRHAMADAEREADPEAADRIARFRDNALRHTRVFHAEPTHFHFPGLREREYHERSLFPWLARIEAATDIIQAEFEAVAGAERAELVPYVQYAADAPVAQWKALNHSLDWTAIHLLQNGRRVEANARYCPQLMDLLETLPQPDIPGCSPNAMFSLLAPDTTIPPHNGVANTRLVCHLPLIVPEGCWFRVGAETRYWRRGEAWLFDDTIEHEARNPSDQLRVILIIDIWHPGLDPIERDAVRALLAAEAGTVSQAL